MKKRILIIIAAAALAALIALSVMAFSPAKQANAKAAKTAKAEATGFDFKDGAYTSDLTPAYIVLDTEESFAYLNFYGPISSYAHGGRYTIEDGKLRCGGYTFRILRDGGLEFIESESPYPGMAFFPNWLYTFEDGTVFRFDPNARLI